MGIPRVVHKSFNHLLNLMKSLGLSISQSKLVPPSTKVVCLGVFIDIQAGTISTPPVMLRLWSGQNIIRTGK